MVSAAQGPEQIRAELKVHCNLLITLPMLIILCGFTDALEPGNSERSGSPVLPMINTNASAVSESPVLFLRYIKLKRVRR